jgi:hypothetical protein
MVFLLFLGVQLTLQWFSGTFNREFGTHPDEAAHYVTGLMVHDYIGSEDLGSPFKFAENYYIHYPKVAIGHWPPFFYIVQAAWTSVFSTDRLSLMILMTVLAALLAFSVYRTITNELGAFLGVAAGLFLLAILPVQKFSGMMMAEILLALLCYWAVLCYGKFIDTEKWQWMTGFGIVASLAILTKGNGLALLLVPPLSMIFTGRFHAIKRSSFWLAVIIVLVLCGPFYYFYFDMMRNGIINDFSSFSLMQRAIPFYMYWLIKSVGKALVFFAVIGVVSRFIMPCLKKRSEGIWNAAGILILSTWIFLVIVVPGFENRHLIIAISAIVMFAVAGIKKLPEWLPLAEAHKKHATIILTLLVGLIFATTKFHISSKDYYGYGEVAVRILSDAELTNPVLLVSADPKGEGAFISEVAMREQRPGHILLRASKVLGRSRWDGSEYELLYETPEEIIRYLKKVPVGVVVIDTSLDPERRPLHHKLLLETINAYHEEFELLGSYTLSRNHIISENAILVYGLKNNYRKKPGIISVDMKHMLYKSIQKSFKD